jgi:hypothetical protein
VVDLEYVASLSLVDGILLGEYVVVEKLDAGRDLKTGITTSPLSSAMLYAVHRPDDTQSPRRFNITLFRAMLPSRAPHLITLAFFSRLAAALPVSL